MIAKARLTVGGTEFIFEIEEKDEKDTLNKIITLGNPPRVCTMCGEVGKMKFTTNKDKEGNIYINMKCICSARSSLGSYKTGGYFWKDFEKYQRQLPGTEVPPEPTEE